MLVTTISNIKIHVSKTGVCPQTINKYKVICAAGDTTWPSSCSYGLYQGRDAKVNEKPADV